jgi:hypothetical protein
MAELLRGDGCQMFGHLEVNKVIISILTLPTPYHHTLLSDATPHIPANR